MDTVEEVKNRLSTSEVLSKYIQLKPAGRNQKALCPFHHEKTPSFMVSDEKGIWHCFGCGEGGDIFGFVMKMEGLDFKQALENLARQANVPIEEKGPAGQNRRHKDRLYRILEAAAKFYQAQLAKHPKVKAYLKDRGIKGKAVSEFRVGYSPAGGDKLVKFLKTKGVSGPEMKAAGLIRTSGAGGSTQDLFCSRLMIPLVDTTNRIVGFTGRVLDDSLPKYLNTPQTLLFDKSRFLFGLNVAKEAIRKQDQAVLVEGHMDVIASHQAEVRQVIASGGTALTLPQLKQLSRFTKNVKLAFDQDRAGIIATERAIGIAQTAGVSLYMVDMGTAKDPDDLLKQENGVTAWQKAINQADYVMDWLLKILPGQYDLKSALGKKRLTDRVMSTLGRLADPVEQDHYVQKLADLVGTSPEVIRQKLEANNIHLPQQRQAVYKAAPTKDEHRAVEEELLGLGVNFADTRTSLQDLTEEHFSSDERKQLFKFLKKNQSKTFERQLPKELQQLGNYIKILLFKGEEGYQDWASMDRRIEAFSLAARLQQIRIKDLRQKINQQIKQAEESGNDELRNELLKQFRDLAKSA